MHAAEGRVIADNGYPGSGFAIPQRRRPADPETSRRRLSRDQREVNAAHARQRGPGERATLSSRAGASYARSAAAHTATNLVKACGVPERGTRC